MTPILDLTAILHTRWIAVLESYLDESYESQNLSRFFVVAGWLGEPKHWRQLEERWAEILRRTRPRIREFKSADCLSGTGAFRGWSSRRRQNLVRRLLAVIADTPIEGVASALLLHGRTPRRNADYLVCVNYCIGAITSLALRYPRGERVAYILDDRDKVKPEVEKVRSYYRRQRVMKDIAARVGPLSFDDSSELIPLQAADLLAHTYFRDMMAATTTEQHVAEAAVLRHKVARVYLSRWDADKRQLHTEQRGRWVRVLPRKTPSVRLPPPSFLSQ